MNEFLFVFSCFENPSIAHTFGTTCPIQVGFSAKCISPNEHHFDQIENRKCHMFGLQTDFPRSHHKIILCPNVSMLEKYIQ